MCCLPGLPVQPPGLGAILCQRDTPAPPHAAAPVQIPLSAPQCPRQNMLAPCGPFPRKVRAEQHFSTGSPCCPIQRPSQHLALALPSVPSKPPAASHAPPMLPTGGGVPPRHLVGARARQKPCRGRRRGAGQQQLQQPLSAQAPLSPRRPSITGGSLARARPPGVHQVGAGEVWCRPGRLRAVRALPWCRRIVRLWGLFRAKSGAARRSSTRACRGRMGSYSSSRATTVSRRRWQAPLRLIRWFARK